MRSNTLAVIAFGAVLLLFRGQTVEAWDTRGPWGITCFGVQRGQHRGYARLPPPVYPGRFPGTLPDNVSFLPYQRLAPDRRYAVILPLSSRNYLLPTMRAYQAFANP
jgi:hypothetical protein